MVRSTSVSVFGVTKLVSRVAAVSAMSVLAGCDACGTATAPRPSPTTEQAPSATTTSSANPTATAARSGAASDGSAGIRMGAALVSGAGENSPNDPAPGFRHAASFLARVTFANPGQRVTFELVDRVAMDAESDDAHRILRLSTTAGKETLEATLSLFTGESKDPAASPPRKVRLVVGSERVEVDVAASHLPSRRSRATSNAMKSPLLYLGRWATLLFYAQAADDRGLAVRLLEPPVLDLEGKTHVYPEWPEPGWLWRVRIEQL